MRKVAVLVVHGIGWHADGQQRRGMTDAFFTRLMDPPGSVDLLKKELSRHLSAVGYQIELAHWGKLIEPTQKRFEERYRDLRWDTLRRVAISALGDAAQYSAAVYSKDKKTFPAHDTIHSEISRALKQLADDCGGDAPLVIIGHSLGCHIVSNHIYDEQQARARGDERCHGGTRPLERLETLAAFVTLGCNIPLFVMGAEAPTPIDLQGAPWLNYYDPDDVLGYPLTPLYFPDGNKPADFNLQDIKVEVGRFGIFGTGQTPLSHGYYWDNSVVVRGIGDQICAAAISDLQLAGRASNRPSQV